MHEKGAVWREMTAKTVASTVTTPFVGREREMAALRRMLDDAHAGHGGLAMIGGEPGVGKTRLADELAAEARDRGFLTATGHSYDMEGGLPYQPFAEIMEALARAVPADAFQAWLGNEAPEVARVAPDLHRLFPDLPELGEAAPEEGRRLVLSAWSGFMERAAGAQPILLILDDVHWADESSLLLLQHLARRIAGIPVLVLCTYRDVELDRNRPLAKVLEELIRQRVAHDIVLRRLTEQEVARMIEARGPGPPPATLVSVLFSETDGNPFFVEEVVRHLAEEGRVFGADGDWASGVAIGELEVPRSVRLVVQRRLARLSEGCRRLLADAAIAGRDFSFEVVGALGDQGSAALIDAIDEAVAAALINEAARGTEVRYTFSHELVRQTLLAGISLPRRQRLHLRVAEVMERLYASSLDPHVPDLAFHYRQAGRGAEEKAIDYSVRAGGAAARAFAWGEAIAHYEAALEALEHASAPDLRRRMEVLLALGEAVDTAGDHQRILHEIASAAYEEAVALQADDLAARAAWLACKALEGMHGPYVTSKQDYLEWSERLIRHAPQGSYGSIHAELIQGRLAVARDQAIETDERCTRAWAIARQLGSPTRLLCQIWSTYAPSCQGSRFDTRRQAFAAEISAALAEAPRDLSPDLAEHALTLIAGEALRWGDREEAERIVWSMRTFDERREVPNYHGVAAEFREVLFPYLEGDVAGARDAAIRILDRAAAGVDRGLESHHAVAFGWRASYHLGRAAHDFPHVLDSEERLLQPVRALLSAAVGRDNEARLVLTRRRAIAPPGAVNAPDAWSIWRLLLYVETATLLGDVELIEWFAAPLWGANAITPNENYTTIVNRHLGAAAALLGQPERARQCYERALAEAAAMRFRPEVALTRLGLAELLLGHFPASRAEALEHLAFATAEFETMKMAPSLERARALGEKPLARTAHRLASPGGLSEREVEVIRLLAAGQSNKQIADVLCISVNTVFKHVSSIFEKIGATNRVEAANYAQRQGLVLPPRDNRFR